VKDEAETIVKTLDSVLNVIDCAVIVGTGSTDNTLTLVNDWLGRNHISSEVVTRPWENYAHNRNEALELSKKTGLEYILFMDAHTYLRGDVVAITKTLGNFDCYDVEERYSDVVYARPLIVRAQLPWVWMGITHEYLTCLKPHSMTALKDVWRERDGKTPEQMKQKLERDYEMLIVEHQKHPEDARTTFYLAQTARDLGNDNQAYMLYMKRSTMGAWDEEVWFSLYQAALCLERMNKPEGDIVAAYLMAYDYRPMRAESLYQLARYYRSLGKNVLAFLFAEKAVCIPKPNDRLFVEIEVYTWKSIDEMAVAAYQLGDYRLCANGCQMIVNRVPADQLLRIKDNLKFALEKLGGNDVQKIDS
jgi:glycosyltransferase involved in cell wall biosynthesis